MSFHTVWAVNRRGTHLNALETVDLTARRFDAPHSFLHQQPPSLIRLSSFRAMGLGILQGGLAHATRRPEYAQANNAGAQ
ncbi:MAG: hypothetical protein KC592_18480 [Nitrospira sp.]|nr:hypothetical protein [Nitrospira sp.]